ncbi:hypothetical protein FZEAL_5024 [Fusarium zealandicum]|uniref:Uncharacterized protein n=1 Tax=Fusarium zealandicum TaxID=1053134 RepID=A0A8H4XLA9_9HYPO|nr:hypothetical protein FZEAL_5024 [Fusarium zealandicum]
MIHGPQFQSHSGDLDLIIQASTLRREEHLQTMDSESTTCILPPSNKEVLGPVALVLAGQSISPDGPESTPLYQLSREITPNSQKGASIHFDRVGYGEPEEPERISSVKQQTKHLFYLVHPANAQYRTDVPAYYITSASSETLGNIHFDISKSVIQKTEFKAILSVGRTSGHDVLFDKEAPETLFDVKPKWKGGQYQWIDSQGQKVAHEEGKGDERKLVISSPLKREVGDALVALWALRLWHDMAESRSAKREEMENLTGPLEPSAYGNDKMMKRTGAFGAFAGAGGAG